ncbi:MAG: sel1 repeat family protein [Campylobacteraceae bacterium]|jgi:TPR repeat protein|nr:sel1 repeat family protein [Campylobacteraceae bacterium]
MKKLFLLICLCFFGLCEDGAFNIYLEFEKNKKLCGNGDALACSVVSLIYSWQGDHSRAVEYNKKACYGGNADSCFFVSMAYYNGQGVEQDSLKIFEYAEKGCNDTSALSCAWLGGLYSVGKNVKQDYKKAKEYYDKACDLNLKDACDMYKTLK